MKTGSLTRLAAVVFLLFGLGVAEYGRHLNGEAKEELAAVGQSQTLLNAGLERAKEAGEAAGRERKRLQTPLQKPQPSQGKKLGATRATTITALLSSHPKLLDLHLRSFRASLTGRFGVFYQMAGLSPEQIIKFEDLAQRHEAETIDLAATAAAQGLDNSDPAIDAVRKEQSEQLRASQIALLGDAGYQQLQQFNRAQGALVLVNGASQLGAANDAYAYTQAGQLMQILANASPRFQQGGSFDPNSVDWNSVVAQAATVLSPKQLDTLKAQAQSMRLVTQLVPSYFAQQPSK